MLHPCDHQRHCISTHLHRIVRSHVTGLHQTPFEEQLTGCPAPPSARTFSSDPLAHLWPRPSPHPPPGHPWAWPVPRSWSHHRYKMPHAVKLAQGAWDLPPHATANHRNDGSTHCAGAWGAECRAVDAEAFCQAVDAVASGGNDQSGVTVSRGGQHAQSGPSQLHRHHLRSRARRRIDCTCTRSRTAHAHNRATDPRRALASMADASVR
jgi:hypothetical protein